MLPVNWFSFLWLGRIGDEIFLRRSFFLRKYGAKSEVVRHKFFFLKDLVEIDWEFNMEDFMTFCF